MDDNNYRMPPKTRKNSLVRRVFRSICTLLGFLLLIGGAYVLWLKYTQAPTAVSLPVADAPFINQIRKLPPEEPEPLRLHDIVYPVGKIVLAGNRADYKDDSMILSIPCIDLEVSVLSLPDPNEAGEDAVNNKLNEGVGLFYCSQLPGPENANVSIAGHRDIRGMEFYYLDKIAAGDLMYLTWNGKRYIYEYYDTMITGPSDWTAIKVRNFSALTLQTCTPINVASHRMFVIGKLIGIEEQD